MDDPEEEKAMNIDAQELRPPPDGTANGASGPQRQDAMREQWLSELERESFALRDESLPPGKKPELLVSEPPGGSATPVGDAPARDPFALPADVQALFATPATRAMVAATGSAAIGKSGGVQPSMPEPRGLEGWQIATLASRGSRSPDAAGLRLAQRYDALMNQLRFTDVNVRLTQSGSGELTLWIRDFRQKYAVEMFNWVRDLQGLLAEKGSTVSRIMVNGKPITHVNELLGGSTWP